MREEIIFHFDGALAATSRMNFYEAARFQYDASRLLVKLDQFRQEGGFVSKITNRSNRQILLEPHRAGSFDISLITQGEGGEKPPFLDTSLSTLLAYVGERVIGKTADGPIATILNSRADLVERYGEFEEDDNVDQIIVDILGDPKYRKRLSPDAIELLERRLAEIAREDAVEADMRQILKIDEAREQRLISMAAPLFTGMATAFRKSARTLHVISRRDEGDRNVIYLNKDLAAEIGTSKVDPDITPILSNIIQYNKETGWGKVRMDISPVPLSFSVPSDMKSELQRDLVGAMRKDHTYIQVRFVRDKVGEIMRCFIVGILPIPD